MRGQWRDEYGKHEGSMCHRTPKGEENITLNGTSRAILKGEPTVQT